MVFPYLSAPDVQNALRIRRPAAPSAEDHGRPDREVDVTSPRPVDLSDAIAGVREKNRQFLAGPVGNVVLFFRRAEALGWVWDHQFGNESAETRKWRRKPLKPLKMDSEMAIRSLAVLQRIAPQEPSSSAPRPLLTA
jgi:hypothetical protein